MYPLLITYEQRWLSDVRINITWQTICNTDKAKWYSRTETYTRLQHEEDKRWECRKKLCILFVIWI